MKTPIRSLYLAFVAALSVLSITQAQAVNVKTLGAVGNGIADDTAAFQAALSGSDPTVDIPPGRYVIRTTLSLDRKYVWTIKGQGIATLVWDGAVDGTLFKICGAGVTIRDLYFDGNDKAGILLNFVDPLQNFGDNWNRLDHVSFTNATTGVQMATSDTDVNNSCVSFDFIAFGDLDYGFRVMNNQGIDFLFNHVFSLRVGTVFCFDRGGMATINNPQCTNCDTMLKVGGGGPSAGTFVVNNPHLEQVAPILSRPKLVVTLPAPEYIHYKPLLVNVNINGAVDAVATNPSAEPLCNLGPRTNVTIQNSMFRNPPLANLTGTVYAGSALVTRECSFTSVAPSDLSTINANAYGFYKLTNNFDVRINPLQDVIKWPSLAPIIR